MPATRAALAAAVLLALASAAPAQPRATADAPPIFVEGVALDSGLRTLLREETERAHEDARAWFGRGLDRPVTVVWVTERDEFRAVAGRDPGAIAGMASPPHGRIVLFAPPLMSRPDRIVSVLRHEMWHLVFARATAGASVEAPRWLDEGLATWRSGEWDLDFELRRDRAAWIRDAAAAGALFAFEDLDARFPDGVRVPLAYAQSASFVEWLAARGGEAKLREFLAALDRDLDPDPAARRTWGVGLPALEREWRNTVVTEGPLGRLPTAVTLGVWAGVVLGILVVAAYFRKRRRMTRLPDEDLPIPPT